MPEKLLRTEPELRPLRPADADVSRALTIALRLEGVLNRPVLERSLSAIVQRHESLRAFSAIDGKPVQAVAPHLKLAMRVAQLPDLPEPERASEIRKFAVEERREIFEAADGPLLRALLLGESSTSHVLLLTIHPLVADHKSTEALFRELGSLYGALLKDQPSSLPDLSVRYADYAAGRRLQGQRLAEQLAYWKKKLARPAPVLPIPSDRPSLGTFSRGAETLPLPKALSESLRAFSRREDVTLFTLALAAFNALLCRYSGQEDILVGTPIANRNPRVEGLIGFFANTLVLRTDLSDDPSFRELLGRVREVSLEASAHADLPFETLVEQLPSDRVFRVLFAMQNPPAALPDLEQLEVSRLDVDNGAAGCDLSLFVIEEAESLSLKFEYNTDLFDADRIRRMLHQLQALLAAVVANPDERVSTLPLLSAGERAELLAICSRETEYRADQCLQSLFEIQAERTPDAIALVFEKQRVTYRQLNEKANRLAHYLRSLGVGPEVCVAIFMDRSVEAVVAILAVLKAGGGYLPMEAAYPADRLAFMLQDSKAAVLLTESGMADSLPPHTGHTICVDRAEAILSTQPETNPATSSASENMAYMIYTSGSTGQPKGCVITHHNVARLMRATEPWYGFNEHDVWTLFHSFAFDFSVWEIWGALLYGGRLVVVPYLVSRSPEEFYELLAAEQVTVLNQTPSAFRQLMRAEESVGVKKLALRYVIFGGEALEMQSLRPWFDAHGDQQPRLVNMYGITETTVFVTYRPLSSDDLSSASVIGIPIPDLQVYILDPNGQPVPVGVPGEIFVGGSGLGRGYLNRPELTAERFIADHLSGRPGSRLYKTGDLARFLPDFEIEYLGRIDTQVKIRGFRIELGEIEAALYQHPAVQQALVIAREDAADDKRLVAYISLKTEHGSGAPDTAVNSEYVTGWQSIFDETYDQGAEAADRKFNITGWNSSHTGKPIPAEEMRIWVDSTVERILKLRPSHVWEIGCGTGLLLFRLAPGSVRYEATDFSAKVIDALREQIATEAQLPQVSLRQAGADEFPPDRAESFDVVILNSVAQYFPGIDYLVHVLENVTPTVKRGGAIFLGDLRAAQLLEPFHAAVQLDQAPTSLPCGELRQRIKRALTQEKELTIAPGFFDALKRHLPAITEVEIQLKRGSHHNELTQFRYDVVLRVGGETSLEPDWRQLDWRRQGLSVSDLNRYLLREKPVAVTVTGVPNARVERELRILELLDRADCPATAGDLRKTLVRERRAKAIEPEEFWALGAALGYEVQICWSEEAGIGCYDVIFLQPGCSMSQSMSSFPSEQKAGRNSWRAYANDPLHGMFARNVVPQLRGLLEKKLPEYMTPSAFVLLDQFPLTPNGKLDLRALPPPDSARPADGPGFVAPRTETEAALAGLWADILALDRVSIHDNFFEFGGHSLLATQLVSRIRRVLDVNAPLLSLFDRPTVAGYAEYIEAVRWTSAKRNGSLAREEQFEEGEI